MTQVRIGSQLRCPYCHDALVGLGRKAGCEACFAWHHAACLAELGRCGNCGVAKPPPQKRSLEFERTRLNELLAKSCVHQGCRSIETIAVGSSYLCRRHAREQTFLLWGVGVSLALVTFVTIAFMFVQSPHLDGDDAFLLTFMGSLMLIPAGLVGWRARVLRAALEAAEESEGSEVPSSQASSLATPPTQLDQDTPAKSQVASMRKLPQPKAKPKVQDQIPA